MVNYLHSLFHRPEKGWDPVTREGAEQYAALMDRRGLDVKSLDQIEQWLGGFRGKRVLDLAAGPAQHSVAMAQRGALVTWHDVSGNYKKMAEARAAQAGVPLTTSLGYLEEAKKFLSQPFDLVYSRISWYYCMNDFHFTRLFVQLIKPGGMGYIETPNHLFAEDWKRRPWIYGINRWVGIKLGHPHPPQNRLASLILSTNPQKLLIDSSSRDRIDKIFFIRA